MGKKIALWGLAFKPETDDIRESPAVKLARVLLDKGATVSCHDPEAGLARPVQGISLAGELARAAAGRQARVARVPDQPRG